MVDLPPVLKSPNAWIFDDRSLQKHGIQLPDNIRAQAVLLHPRTGYYEQFRSLIIGVLIALTVSLLLVVTGSAVYLSRKNRALSLAQSSAESANALFNKLAEQTRTVHWEVNTEGLYTYISDISEAVIGYRPEEIIGKKHFYDLRPAEGREAFKSEVFEAFARREVVSDLENMLQTRDRRPIWVSTNGIPSLDSNGKLEGYRGSDTDITDRKHAAVALQESEARLRGILESTDNGILAVDPSGKTVFSNRRFAELWRIPRSLVNTSDDKAMLEFVLEQLVDPDGFLRKVKQLYETTDIDTDIIQFKDGRLFERYSMPMMGDGFVIGRLWSFRDITERKRAEEALSEAEVRQRTILNNLPFMAWLKDTEGRFIMVNQQFAKACGCTVEQVVGLTDLDIWPPELAEKYRADDAVVMATRCGKEVEELVAETSGIKWFETIKAPIFNIRMEVTGTTGLARDITERKRAEEEKRILEERLNRAEKMESLGVLAGGVAHDLNNVLGVILGYSELLLLREDKSSANRPPLEAIMKGCQRATAIVQDLLTLARRGVLGRDVVNLNRIVTDLSKSPEFQSLSAYHPSVQFQYNLEPDLPNICGSSVHLGKTLFNLVSNGCEAMPKGGIVKIRTVREYLDKPIRGYDEVQKGDYVVLTVSDSGEGISEADLKRIFEPFFTKKAMGRSGTGLGLTVVWGTVKDHNGYIDVQSEEGKGSTFTLYLPSTRENITAERVPVPPSEYIGKGEFILVVDDVKEQRDLATDMLQKLNYGVSSVASGKEAVAYLKEHPCDLLILDMIMDPGMDGLDTYKKVLEISPKQKAIIVSGFSESERVRAAQALGAGAYVRKPYVIETLGRAVRKELDRT
jgi:PAS domain S-box-containing protein